MKLIYCPECRDIVKLRWDGIRFCVCRESWGEYINYQDAQIGGVAIPISIVDASLADAICGRPEIDPGYGRRFDAFVIPRNCPTVEEIAT